MTQNTTASSRYLELASYRQTVLDIARDCAEMTLPYLLTRSGSGKHQQLVEPWQSVGARGVNVMASKLLLSAMPPTTSFFKLQINDGQYTKNPEMDAAIKAEVDAVLARTERIILQHIASTQDRAVLFTAFKHLVVTGNVLAFMPDKKDLKLYPLNRYVIDRDGGRRPLEILTVEVVNRKVLPKEFQSPNTEESSAVGSGAAIHDGPIDPDEVEVFTWAKLDIDDNMWRWHQEAEDKVIPGSQGQAKDDVCPWLPLRFNRIDGEDYGRGRIEEYRGDLRSLDSLMQSLVEGAAGSAKFVWLVAPSASMSPQELAKAKNMAIMQGREGDVSVVQAAKAQDLAVAQAMVEVLTQRLDEAFLVFSPRQSERTTAEEIRSTQQELNEQLGGNLGNITVELLQPYLKRKMFILRKEGQLPALPEDMVFPTIVTGMDGIGRGQDREALVVFAQTLQGTVGPEAMNQHMHVSEYISRLAASVGIDALGLIKTKEEMDQEMQQANEQAAAEQQMANQPGMARAEVEAMKLQQQQQPTNDSQPQA